MFTLEELVCLGHCPMSKNNRFEPDSSTDLYYHGTAKALRRKWEEKQRHADVCAQLLGRERCMRVCIMITFSVFQTIYSWNLGYECTYTHTLHLVVIIEMNISCQRCPLSFLLSGNTTGGEQANAKNQADERSCMLYPSKKGYHHNVENDKLNP